MNTPVSFKLAKLLKEKVFAKPVYQYYRDSTIVRMSSPNNINQHGEGFIAAPTIAEVVMWLYEEHGIWITIDVGHKEGKFFYILMDMSLKQDRQINTKLNYFNSPTEAYESAILYTLNNLT